MTTITNSFMNFEMIKDYRQAAYGRTRTARCYFSNDLYCAIGF